MNRSTSIVITLSLMLAFLAGPVAWGGIINSITGAPDPSWNSNSMQLWLRADAGVTTGATFVWADQSNHHNNASQSTSGDKPEQRASGPGLINDRPVVYFDGDDSLAGSLENSLSPDSFTAFIVLQAENATSSYHSFDGPSSSKRFAFASYSTHSAKYFVQFASTETGTVGGTNAPTLFAALGTPVDTNTVSQFINGTLSVTGSFSSVVSINGYRVGARYDGTTAHLQGGIAELIIYDRALNDYELGAVGYYLQEKYNIPSGYIIPEPSALPLLLCGSAVLALLRPAARQRK